MENIDFVVLVLFLEWCALVFVLFKEIRFLEKKIKMYQEIVEKIEKMLDK